MMEVDRILPSDELDPNLDPMTQDQDVDNDLYSKRDGMDIVLWTLQRALRKKHTIGDPKDDDEDDTGLTLEPKASEITTAGYSMESLIGPFPTEKTELEEVIQSQSGLPVMPFHNMDRSGRSICTLFLKDRCPHGTKCHLRHLKGDKTVVCKHWLRGLCKKGDDCEFLHEYDLSKMPECFFFSRYNACSNKECTFRHIDPESKIKDCPWYDRGFCRHGPYCKYRHRRRILCDAYMVGFCPEGPDCPHFHPPNTMPPPELPTVQNNKFTTTLLCHNCHERGHKASNCPRLPMRTNMPVVQQRSQGNFEPRKSLSEVVCFKCGSKGHYANRCTNAGAMAFLRQNPAGESNGTD